MGFVEVMINSKFLPKMLLKEGLNSPKKWRKTEYKDRKTQNRAGPDAGTAVLLRKAAHAPGARVAVRPSTAGQASIVPASPILLRVHGRAPLSHTRTLRCFPLLCYPGCSWLPWTSNLPWNRSWSLLSIETWWFSLEMKIKYILGTIWIKGR